MKQPKKKAITMFAFGFVAGAMIADLSYPARSAAELFCTTDTECAELCPEGTRDLLLDNSEYCDGGR